MRFAASSTGTLPPHNVARLHADIDIVFFHGVQ
jgi:hypothetical protein